MIKAQKCYDPSLGEWSTYVYKVVLNDIIKLINNKAKKDKIEGMDSHNRPICEDEPNEDDKLSLVRSEDDTEADARFNILYEKLMNNLEEREKQIVLMRVRDLTHEEIGSELGITHHRVQQIKKSNGRLMIEG